MKKIILFLVLFIFGAANATTMCVRTGSYVATLLRSRDGQSYTTDENGGWTVTFDYYTSSNNTMNVTGLAACNEVTGTANTADGTVSTSTADQGENCWCIMNTPLISDWVFLDTYASASACASACDAACATAVKTSTTFRTALYESIW